MIKWATETSQENLSFTIFLVTYWEKKTRSYVNMTVFYKI